MSHILGVYWSPGHQRPTDIEYMTRLQPPAIRVLDPDPNQLTIAFRAAPNALLLPRDWALSEQHDDVRSDPVGTGKRHAQDWRGKIDRWRASGAPLPSDNQIVVVGINEPQVWTMLPQTVEYNVAMLDECTRLGLRACALNLSVGWPANNGTDTPPDWTPYKPVEAAIKRGNHVLVVHSYWYKSGPQDGAGWWAWRHHACPWDVPIIIGECGIDNYVDMKRWENDGKPNRGWRGNISPEQYAAQMEQYARGCDRRVTAILPFLTDYRSNNWESFDTQEAHNALVARKDNMVPQASFGTPPALPPTPQPPAPIETRLPSIEVPTPAPTPAPAPVPTGGNWQRSRAFIARWEGGWADNPDDPGGATNKGITIGTYTQWLREHGQAVPTKDDLRNISDEETDRIFYEWYWLRSGADKIEWPLCLAHFDTAVNAGPGRAAEMMQKSGGNFLLYVAELLDWYARISSFEHFGRAWTRRRADLLREAAK